MMNKKCKTPGNILLSPLNWGLGHSTRLIPIIDKLIKDGYTCIIAGESPSIDILKDTFPELEYIHSKGFSVQFSKGSQQWFKLLIQLPSFIKSIYKDKKQVKKILESKHIDLIVSDNRYGFRNHRVRSIIISHQTSPETGRQWLKPLITKIVSTLLNKFDALWLPDSNSKFSGNLSKAKIKIPTYSIGLLSRLAIIDNEHKLSTFDTPYRLIVLSGPEPHRSILEQLLIEKFSQCKHKTLILQALPTQSKQKPNIGSISFMANCSSEQLYHLMKYSTIIICRSGYSTIMDLLFMKRKAILIPTPGQYEQEYLAKHMASNHQFTMMDQDKICYSSIHDFKKQNSESKQTKPIDFCQLPPIESLT